MLDNVIENQKLYLLENEFSIHERKEALFLLKENIVKYTDEISNALFLDLNKSKKESYISEIMITIHEIDYMLKHIEGFFKPKKVKTPLFLFPSKSYIYRKPYGCVLIISPWNYPFQLAMIPLISALACGNSVILKTSRKVPNTNKIIKKIINKSVNSNLIYICEDESYDEILDGHYDFVFFTGSTKIGKEILSKISKNLCPVVLELGGKSPVIIDNTASLNTTAKRLSFGKLLNAGQTCIAPDYVLIDKKIKKVFLKIFKEEINKQYNEMKEKNEYSKMITSEKVDSMYEIIKSDFEIDKSFFDVDNRFIKPIILENVSFDSKIMQEEIFAPVLPFIEFENLDDVIEILKRKPIPLATYIFSESKKNIEKITTRLKFGGCCINETLNHIANINLPFGGQKESGIGKYHGKASLDLFSSQTSILKSSTFFDMNFKYYPFSEKFLKIFKKFFIYSQ